MPEMISHIALESLEELSGEKGGEGELGKFRQSPLFLLGYLCPGREEEIEQRHDAEKGS